MGSIPFECISYFRYACDPGITSPVQGPASPDSSGYMDVSANPGQQSSGCKEQDLDSDTPFTHPPFLMIKRDVF